MKTERLLDELASGLTPVRTRSARRDGMMIGALALIELALFLMLGLSRPDMHHAMGQMSFWWKLAKVRASGDALAVRPSTGSGRTENRERLI
jgi:hypothetical protein